MAALIGRSILVIVRALLDGHAQLVHLGPDYYASRTTPDAGSSATSENYKPSARPSPLNRAA